MDTATLRAMSVNTDSTMGTVVNTPACLVQDHGLVVQTATTAWLSLLHHPGSLGTLSFAINGAQMAMEVSVGMV